MQFTLEELAVDNANETNDLDQAVIEQSLTDAMESIYIACEDINSIMKYRKSVMAAESFDENTTAFIHNALEGFYDLYEFERPGHMAIESFSSNTKTYALEGFTDIINRIWEAIKNTFKAIWDFIANSFNWLDKKANDNKVKAAAYKNQFEIVKEDIKSGKKQEPSAYVDIDDIEIIKGFGDYQGEIKSQQLIKFITETKELYEKIEVILNALDKDTVELQNFSSDVAQGMKNRSAVDLMSDLLQHTMKLQTTATISHEFKFEPNVPDNVLQHAHLTAVDSKLTRISQGLSHGYQIYFLKPLEEQSFYRIIKNQRQVDKPRCSIHYFKPEDLEHVIKAVPDNENGYVKSRTFLTDLQKNQENQIRIIDGLINGLPSLEAEGHDVEKVRQLLNRTFDLTKQSAAIARDLFRILEGTVNSDKFYNDLISKMIKYIAKTPETETK